MTAATFSLRNRLLVAGGVGALLLSALATWLLGSLFERVVREAFDRQLGEDLISLLALVESDDQGRIQMRHDPDDPRYGRVFSGAYWQIFDPQGHALLQSHSLWDESLTPPAGLDDGRAHALDLSGPMQQPLRARLQRVKLPRSEQPLLFVVAADRQHIGQQVGYFRRHTAIALAIMSVLSGALLITQVLYGLRPLARLGQTAARVRAGEAARFPEHGLPAEVQPLAGHLNELLEHHGRMVERARNSAADLAHALKTPLAVLIAESEGDGEHWRQTLREQTTRMRASVERYLAAGVAADPRQRTPVAEVVTALAALMGSVHRERPIRIETATATPAVFAGAREDLEEMLGNLLDNACKWANERVIVTWRRDELRLLIEIADDGPGLPAEQLQRVLARGVRLDQREPGSGLGLAIVEDIAGNYGGHLQLSNRASGLCAQLELPAAPPPPA